VGADWSCWVVEFKESPTLFEVISDDDVLIFFNLPSEFIFDSGVFYV